ncbi:MAG TPA: histidine phosphatase family protein [Xanthobacteraceae bacterium]|jgi:probable phosphoglycerate mutase
MTKILLTRHGYVEGIRPERFRGRAPLELTARGREEAKAVAKRIADSWQPRKIYTSPLGRCVATGAAIAQACGIAAEVCDDLNDIDYGAWQFKTHEEARAQNPALFASWFAAPHLVRFPNGESLQDLAARSADAVRFLLCRHADDTIVLVGHDSVNRVLLLQFFDLPLSAYRRVAQEPCGLNEIDIDKNDVCILRVNETWHLHALATSEPTR